MGRRQRKGRLPKGDVTGQARAASRRVALAQPVMPPVEPRPQSAFLKLAVCGFLVAAIVAVFGQSARFEFLNYDDPFYVSENPVLEHGATWKAVAWSFTTFQAANWHPVTWLSHMLDCQFFDLDAGWHHAVNVAIHLANSTVLYLLLLRMTAAPWRSAAVAALFALHPLHVESVVWVAERKDVLSTLFALLAIFAYLRYVLRPSVARYLAVAVLLALGLMSKPMVVTLPFVLLLLDYWPLGRMNLAMLSWRGGGAAAPDTLLPISAAWQLVVEKLPLLLLSAASSVVTYVAQQREGAMEFFGDVPSLAARWANAMVAYVAYLGKTVWPVRLIVFYPYVVQRPLWQPALAVAFLIAVTCFALWLWRKRPYLIVGWFWYLGTLVPVIGLIQVGGQSIADRYTYFPLIGIFILGVWGIADLATGLPHRRAILATVAGGAVLACILLSARQTAHWRNTESLFEYVLTVSPDNAAAHDNLAQICLQEGRNEEAEKHARELERIDPHRRAKARLYWGTSLLIRHRFSEAIEQFQEAVRLDPNMALARNDLATALAQAAKLQGAVDQLHEAVRLAPDRPEARKQPCLGTGDLPRPKASRRCEGGGTGRAGGEARRQPEARVP